MSRTAWYFTLGRNLTKAPDVEVQVKDEVFRARAYTAGGEKRDRLWRAMAEIWPPYDEYVEKTERKIPVVVLERS